MKYPLYILTNDDFGIHVIKAPNDLSYMEKIDVESGLYSGWDADSYPFKVFWDGTNGVKLEPVSNQPQGDVLQATINKYKDFPRNLRLAVGCSIV